jgi:hypothetical protein
MAVVGLSVLSLVLSCAVLKPAVYRPVVLNFITWTPLGFIHEPRRKDMIFRNSEVCADVLPTLSPLPL